MREESQGKVPKNKTEMKLILKRHNLGSQRI